MIDIAQAPEDIETLKRRLKYAMNAIASVYDSLDKSVTQCRELQKENKELKTRCAEAYQLAGVVGAPLRFLDALGDAANGEIGKRFSGNLLPVAALECDEIAKLQRKLEESHTREALDYSIIMDEMNRVKVENFMSANKIAELQRENEVLKSAIAKQARAAIAGMDAAKSGAYSMLEAAKKAQAESSPDALASERAANAALTEEVERLQRELEEARNLLMERGERDE